VSATPVTLLTGFLGAGKTTLLNHLLASASGRVAVVENEFGAVDIDSQLVGGPAAAVFGLREGCACCEVRDDLVRLFEGLAEPGAPAYDHVFIEASGLAEPGPILRVFESAALRERFRLNGVVTVVDAQGVLADLDAHGSCEEQVAFADLIVVNKVDLVGDAVLAQVSARLQRIHAVPVVQAIRSQVAPEQVFQLERQALPSHEHEHEHDHDHDHHTHDASVRSVAVELASELDLRAFDRWLGDLVRDPDLDILRMKGVLAFAGDPLRWVFQAVRRTVEVQPGDPWAGERPHCQVVFIGRGLSEERLRKGMTDCVAIPV